MKKILMAVMGIALLFAVTGCDYGSLVEAFSANAYTEMEPNENPEIDLGDVDFNDGNAVEQATADLAVDLADAVAEGTVDDRFFEDIAETAGDDGVDNQEVQVVLNALDVAVVNEIAEALGLEEGEEPDLSYEALAGDEAIIGNDAIQDLAIMQADVALAASGADELVTNLNSVLGSLLTGGDDEGEGDTGEGDTGAGEEESDDMITSIITEIFTVGEEDMTPEEEVESVSSMLTGLLASADAFSLYGATLMDPDDVLDETDPDYVDPDSYTASGENSGDLAIQAVLAGATSLLVDAVANTDDTMSEEDQAAAEAEAIAELAGALTAEDPGAELELLLDGADLFGTGDDGAGEGEAEEESFLDIFDPGIAAVVNTGFGDLLSTFLGSGDADTTDETTGTGE